MSHQANAILAISSTDRYVTNLRGNSNQPVSNTLAAQYNNGLPYSNDFSITAPNALMNGYIKKIIISQIQLQYNLPTVIPGGNDLLVFAIETSSGSGVFSLLPITIPFGYYSPAELAAVLQTQLFGIYTPPDRPPGEEVFFITYSQTSVLNIIFFEIRLISLGRRFYFPTPAQLAINGYNVLDIERILKAYKLFGFTIANDAPETVQSSFNSPQLLYTPFIDIYSDALTNYQKLKDTDSSTSRRKGLIARVYVSGVGNPQITLPGINLGSAPFMITIDLNSPKVINWSPDTAINSLDFQMRDCYGDLLFYNTPSVNEIFNTEFQMTLLCVE